MRKQRAIPVLAGLEMRSNDANGHSLVGYVARFDSDSHPIGGKYVESIAPGAFQRSLQAPPHGRQTLVIDHDDSRIIGATNDTRGTHFVEDSQGLWVDAPNLPDTTQVRDLRELGDAGLLSGMSFEFLPTAKGMQTLDGGKRRRLSDVILYHGTVLTGKQPAYGATTVEVRALAGAAGVDADVLGSLLDAVHEGRQLDEAELEVLATTITSLAPAESRWSAFAGQAAGAAWSLSGLLDRLAGEDPGDAQDLLKTAVDALTAYITAKTAAVGSEADKAASEPAYRSATPLLDAARALITR
jgi:HK97 family phage prohead protease